MKICYLDIETTGLDPENNQILSIGAAIGDLKRCTVGPTFEMYVAHSQLTGHPKAFAINKQYFETVESFHEPFVDAEGDDVLGYHSLDVVMEHLKNFLWKNFGKDEKVTFGGKNFGAFDLQFLKRAPRWENIKHHHRYMDAGPLWTRPEDEVMPNLQLCANRAGVLYDPNQAHSALYDARVVMHCVHNYYFKDV